MIFSDPTAHLLLLRDGPLFFYRRVTIFGTCRQFFPKNNAFQTFFSLHFGMKTIFYDHFKNVTGFYRSYLKQTHLVHACIHMKVSSE